MSNDAGAIERLKDDLQRPAGGWTIGLITLLLPMAVISLGILGYWPGPRWTELSSMFALFVVHMIWGAHGYYPRRI